MEIEQGKDKTVQTYVIPVKLTEVRPKVKEFANEHLMEAVEVNAPKDKAFLEAIKAHHFNEERIVLALKVAKHYHHHQKRKSGEPYYEHPLEVATLLLPHTKDENTVIAALLHDTIEDTAYTANQLTAMFGDKVSHIVTQVTHLYHRTNRPKIKLNKGNVLTQLLQAGNKDASLVKLFDRLHNMRTLSAKSKARQQAIAQETKKLFIPLAKKLNLPTVAEELGKLVDAAL